MFQAIAATQWKWTRTTALLAAVVGFTLPIASLQSAHETTTPQDFIARMQNWGIGYALLAAGSGLLIALAAWGHDHQGRHVYALSLPVSRARYVMLRFGAGALFLAPITLAVLAGSVIVAMSGAIPQGLHAFPFALTLRFALAGLVSYAIFFAIGSGTTRTAAVVLGSFAFLLFVQFILSLVNVDFNLLSRLGDFVFDRPGLLSVFSGRWMLIDV